MTTRDDIMRRVEEMDREEAALLSTLEIPEYSNRRLQPQTVKSREHTEGSEYYAITGSSGWTAGCSPEVYDLLPEGKPYILETQNLSYITGWIIDGKWYDRKSDQDLAREHQAFRDNVARERRESLEKNRASWQERQDALPEWIRARLEGFHRTGGEDFALDGWGYELCVAELAVLYADMDPTLLEDKDSLHVEDSEAIRQYARDHGTSGNQHGMALALAKAHQESPDRTMVGTVSALSPLTGDPDYSGKRG